MVSEPTLAVSRTRTGISAGAWARARGGADATSMWTGAWRVSVRASGMRRWHWTHGSGTATVGTGRTNVAHVLLALDVRDVAKRGHSWLGIDRRGRRSLKGVSMWYPDLGLNRINRILISISCNFFSGSRSPKNSEVKRAWPGAIWGWMSDREVIPGCARVRTKCAEKTCVGLWGQSMS